MAAIVTVGARPHLLVKAQTHGTAFCGRVAATHLLDEGSRLARASQSPYPGISRSSTRIIAAK
jgi:hypothetical protein